MGMDDGLECRLSHSIPTNMHTKETWQLLPMWRTAMPKQEEGSNLSLEGNHLRKVEWSLRRLVSRY